LRTCAAATLPNNLSRYGCRPLSELSRKRYALVWSGQGRDYNAPRRGNCYEKHNFDNTSHVCICRLRLRTIGADRQQEPLGPGQVETSGRLQVRRDR